MPTFRNFAVGLKVVQTGYVHEKVPLILDDYVEKNVRNGRNWLISHFLIQQVVAEPKPDSFLKKSSIILLKKIEIIDENGKEVEAISKQYQDHTIRCKGKSIQGKSRKMKFGEGAMHWSMRWLEERGDDDSPYMFAIKKKDGSETHQVGKVFL